jgi:hypothetical protein
MTEPTRINLDDATPPNSRVLARQIAAQMAMNKEIPTAEAVRKRIVEQTGGEINPSASTIQSEMKAWFADEFWPTYHAMGAVPADSSIPADVRSLFQSSFQTMVVQLFAAARASFDAERQEFQRQVAEADRVVQDLQIKVSELEQRATTAEEHYQAEVRAHADARLQLDASNTQVHELNAKLHAAHELQAAHEQRLNDVRTSERERADTQIAAARDDAQRHLQEIDNLRQRVKALDLSLASQTSENRRLGLEHARIAGEAAALAQELKNTQASNAREIERLLAALRVAQTNQPQGERMKPARRAAGGTTAAARSAGRTKRSLHKPTRNT